MPIIRNWKTYYTIEEVDKKLKESIRKNAKEVAAEIKKNVLSNNKVYV